FGNGCAVIDTRAGTIAQITLSYLELPRAIVDNQNKIWLVTNHPYGTVNIIDFDNNSRKEIGQEQGVFDRTSALLGIVQDHDQNVWVSSRGKGMYIVDLKKNVVKHLTTANGLWNNELYSAMLIDPRTNRICTFLLDGSLILIDPLHKKITKYGKEQDIAK